MKLLLVFFIILSANLWSQSTPLVLQHADSMSFDRKSGRTELYRNVKFKHDSLDFRAQFAKWDRRTDRVDFKGGFSFKHPKGLIKAKTGKYFRKQDHAKAYHDVFMQDSLGEIQLQGDTLDYKRLTSLVKIWGSPTLYRFPSADEKASQINAASPEKTLIQEEDITSRDDTLAISGKLLRFNQETRIAQAWDSVVIDRGKMHVTCDSALLDTKGGYLKLVGSPQAQVGTYEVRGARMEIWFEKESLQRIKVWKDAFGSQKDSISKPGDIQWTQVQGDSMEVFFQEEAVDYLTVEGSGVGRFFDESTKQYVNKVNGKKLVVDFVDSQPQSAKVSEEARTQYYFFKDNGDFGGWNEAQGDSLDLNFDGSQLKTIGIRGNLASGVYMGQSNSKSKKAQKSKKSQKSKQSEKSSNTEDVEAATETEVKASQKMMDRFKKRMKKRKEKQEANE